ncbi:MAG: pitrilysin family protein [Rhodothermales bacterium]
MNNRKSITGSVRRQRIGCADVYLLDVPSEDIVSVAGALPLRNRRETMDEFVSDLLIRMLDKGTQVRDRFEISHQLDMAGAERSYASTDEYLHFRGRSVAKGIGPLMDIIFEELSAPCFDPTQFSSVRAQFDHAVLRSMESTSSMASDQLQRMIYSPDHPNYQFLGSTVRLAYSDTSVDDLVDRHEHVSRSPAFVLVLVGSIDESAVLSALEKGIARFADSGDGDPITVPIERQSTRFSSRTRLYSMRDKQNLDVAAGFPLPILRSDAEFVPAYVASYILGGNFSSRLMQQVRDERGLTYGIRSGLSGITVGHGGHFQVAVTLSQQSLLEGLAVTRKVVADYFAEGATTAEVEQKKATIRGSYSARLSTTLSLAAAIRQGVELGYGPHYPDTYRDEISRVAVSDINEAIATYFRDVPMAVSVAGTIDETTAAALLREE